MINSKALYAQLDKYAKLKNPFLVTHTQQYSYQDLLSHVQLMCDVFARLNVQEQDRVGLWTESPFWHAVTSWTGILTGVSIVVVPAMKSTPATTQFAEQYKCKICVYDVEGETYFEDCTRSKLSRFFFNEKKFAITQLLRTAQPKTPSYETVASDTAFVVFSSGTTGKQKGIRWSYKALLTHIETNINLFKYQPGMALCNGLSLEHSDGFFNGYMMCVATGMTWIRPDKFSFGNLPKWNQLMLNNQADILVGVPSMFEMMVYADSTNGSVSALDAFINLKYILSTADKIKPSTWRALEQRYAKVGNIFGLSETVNGGIYTLPGEADDYETAGIPVDLEVKIIGEQDETLSAGQEGILSLRGDSLFDGYETEDGFEPIDLHDGWFYTNDIAIQQPNGRYRILGRAGEARNIGGLLVHPNEVDACIQTMPNIKTSKTLFVMQETGINEEQLVSFVVATVECPVEDIKQSLSQRLESQKIPRDIIFLENLPISVAGKVDKFALLQEYSLRKRKNTDVGKQKNIEAQILSLAASTLGIPIDQLSLDKVQADTIGWDSFGHINMALAIESHFGIKFTFDEVTQMQTLGEFVTNVMQKQKE
ncbi:MAG TPA: AMP-binding protein [Burkholderiaceae bacterium]|nr:AMP-binding protein [Burkholderiaceae bacterium]